MIATPQQPQKMTIEVTVSVQLSQPDFQRLTRIVQNLLGLVNVRDRRRWVAGALKGLPKADVILARLYLDGTPMEISVT